MAGKRLIVLLDGTWNDRSEGVFDTNIVRLQKLIARSIALETEGTLETRPDVSRKMVHGTVTGGRENFVFYESGVGTGASDRWRGGLLGQGMPKKVRRAYKFLSANYTEGDSIYVFGFSRGAFTARSLVGYLGAAGLLKREFCTDALEAEAWAYYRTHPMDRLPGALCTLQGFTHSRATFRVDCIGVFDTVGALGVPLEVFNRFNREKYAFHTVDMSSITKHNLHAMAIDEHRAPFRNTPWRKPKFKAYKTTTEQVWFAGAHGDIGGGYVPEEDRRDQALPSLDDIALSWMVRRLNALCPDFPCDPALAPAIDESWALAPHHEPRSGKYRLFPPAIRAISNYRVPGLQGRQIEVSRDRQEEPVGEMVHLSALERLGNAVKVEGKEAVYRPPNLLGVLPVIAATYGAAKGRTADHHDILVVDWDGTPLDAQRDDDRAKVLDSLSAARSRLGLS